MDAGARLCLFVTSTSPASEAARKNLECILGETMGEFDDVRIVDVLEDPGSALEAGVMVTPTLAILHNDKRLLIAGRLADIGQVAARINSFC